jgi:hypothetical protein
MPLRCARATHATHTHTRARAGNNEAAQLEAIFKMMGLPNEQTWPGVSQLSL